VTTQQTVLLVVAQLCNAISLQQVVVVQQADVTEMVTAGDWSLSGSADGSLTTQTVDVDVEAAAAGSSPMASACDCSELSTFPLLGPLKQTQRHTLHIYRNKICCLLNNTFSVTNGLQLT